MVATPPLIAVDAMGGDTAPRDVVLGVAEASLSTGAQVLLVGNRDEAARILDSVEHDPSRIELCAAHGTIPMDASPREALQAFPEASLPLAARRVAEPDGPAALVTAGNTGAVVLACAQAFRRLGPIRRTALAAVIPTERTHGDRQDPFSLLLDAGATVRVEAEDLVRFGLMGGAYARLVSQNPHPRVALLSNGTEPNKGTPEVIHAHRALSGATSIDFIGNIEGLDLTRGTADVVICDGFTGNITLKMLEGVSETVTNLARYAYRSRMTWRFAMWLLQNGLDRLKAVTDWQQYGGAPILGFDRLCIKAHGRSGPRAIRNAIRVAERCVVQDLIRRMADDLEGCD
ncbi:MAG: phosphate acyltransferase PlsX [Myxococcota bacterium]